MLRTLAAALVAATLLTSCSDGDAAPPSPTPSVSPFSDSASPSVEPAPPTKPVLPEAATKATPAGAEAFVVYYFDALNYAQATGDIALLKRVSAPQCAVCTGMQRDIRRHYRAGGKIIGGAFSTTATIVGKEFPDPTDAIYAFKLDVSTDHGPQTIVSPDGTRDDRKPATDEWTAYVTWIAGSYWRVDSLTVS